MGRMDEKKKITTFEALEVYKLAREFRKLKATVGIIIKKTSNSVGSRGD